MSERYELVQLPPDDRGRELWAVSDTVSGGLVLSEGKPWTFAIRDTAVGWIQRQKYIEGRIGV
ncbi:hypothetical protein ACFC1R_34110 [Kitasatospora sp. NPDC056138]|uniref:hypothetical protein n=1 Tax=Kitasatospora sp. NPDC056138 TaxID=3345724 RepID=UPI0035DCC19A